MSQTSNKVALTRCTTYDLEQVETAVERVVDLLGGIGMFVKPGQRVALKANLLRPAAPDKACTTHPAVVAAVAKLVIKAGGLPLIIDSSGGPYKPAILRLLYRTTQMDWAAEQSGAELNYDVSTVDVSHPDGHVLKRLELLQPVVDADVLINLPKLKTHNLTRLTLGVKNLFGLIPGTIKIGYHSKLQNNERFSEGLLDIVTCAKPTLTLMDAVIGMEGNGPSGGDPRQIGAILASTNVFALDIAAASLVSFDPLSVLTTRMAVKHGLTTGRLEDVDLVGDPLKELQITGFKSGTATPVDPGLLPRMLRKLLSKANENNDNAPEHRSSLSTGAMGWLGNQLVVYPTAGDKCTGCGYCARHCPVNAITIVDKHAYMDRSMCIRCYCCHELCPELAVELRRPLLARLLSR